MSPFLSVSLSLLLAAYSAQAFVPQSRTILTPLLRVQQLQQQSRNHPCTAAPSSPPSFISFNTANTRLFVSTARNYTADFSSSYFNNNNNNNNNNAHHEQVVDFYHTVGVSRNADAAEIKRAFKRLAKLYHPDANPHQDTSEKFKEINRAYQVLNNPALRRHYDIEQGIAAAAAAAAANGRTRSTVNPTDVGSAGMPFRGGTGGGFTTPFRERTPPSTTPFTQQDIFNSVYGGGGGPAAADTMGSRAARPFGGPIVGEDLRLDLEIDFKTACFGGEQRVRINHLERCSACSGDGFKPETKVEICASCNGSGAAIRVNSPMGNFQTVQPCPKCRGRGRMADEYDGCAACDGQGSNRNTKQIMVTIPPGVSNGNKLRVKGEGDSGPNGGPAGDLYIFLKVKEDSNFRREGSEIYSEANISYLDAALGISFKYPVVDGEVTIEVPPGTQPGQVMRLKGNGVSKLGQPNVRGDHFVTVNIDIPTDLTMEEEFLLKQLKAIQEKKKNNNNNNSNDDNNKKKSGGWFG